MIIYALVMVTAFGIGDYRTSTVFTYNTWEACVEARDDLNREGNKYIKTFSAGTQGLCIPTKKP